MTMATSHPARGAWIEIKLTTNSTSGRRSRSAWGAWIEITLAPSGWPRTRVAPRMGRVD